MKTIGASGAVDDGARSNPPKVDLDPPLEFRLAGAARAEKVEMEEFCEAPPYAWGKPALLGFLCWLKLTSEGVSSNGERSVILEEKDDVRRNQL